MNAYVSSFVFCDSIQEQMTPKGPQYQIINPLQVLTPVAIPSNYSFSVACNIAGFKPQQEHYVSIVFYSPDGVECARPVDNIRFNIPPVTENSAQVKVPVISINIDLRNVVLRQTGI